MSELLPVLVIILIVVGWIEKKRKPSAANRRPPLTQRTPAPVQEKTSAEILGKMSAAIQEKMSPAAREEMSAPHRPVPAPVGSMPAQAAPVKFMRPRLESPIAQGAPTDEGEDPCHAYMLHNQPDARPAREAGEEEGPSESGSQLVRGVIMGEILRRPERRYYGRRRA